MNILILALGSAGDVHPFIGIGKAMAERGHVVTVAAMQPFGSIIEDSGLTFVQAGDEEMYRQTISNPELWQGRRGSLLVFEEVGKHLAELLDGVMENLVGEDDVIVASTMGFAARLVQEAKSVPLVTVHLAPAPLRSTYRSPRLPGAPLPDWAPRWWKRFVWWGADRMIDRIICPPLNAERKRWGLSAVKRPLDRWWNSPELIIGLFPDWFAPLQPDWPPQLRLTGFPLFDEAELRADDAALDQWLAGDSAPLLFTAGSAQQHAADFFRTSVEVCERLDRRGLFVTAAESDLPRPLPSRIVHRSYTPFSRVLPGTAAFIHHGGIGTTAQGLAAGVPQLVIPFSHDQPDNASRLEDLGVGAALRAERYTTDRAVPLLQELLTSDEIGRQCAKLSARLRGHDAIERTCEHIESLGRRQWSADNG